MVALINRQRYATTKGEPFMQLVTSPGSNTEYRPSCRSLPAIRQSWRCFPASVESKPTRSQSLYFRQAVPRICIKVPDAPQSRGIFELPRVVKKALCELKRKREGPTCHSFTSPSHFICQLCSDGSIIPPWFPHHSSHLFLAHFTPPIQKSTQLGLPELRNEPNLLRKICKLVRRLHLCWFSVTHHHTRNHIHWRLRPFHSIT
ncbi:hypothetical protein BJ875DRAFT_150101 [Amylocarpus encephaloides]|uniref:Uncharacterized protein n=1 Tax=Amylocarpus encephaloides TaxID=45428 RepID=A0A9P7YCJ9_9HELO|nr:hypothetical protein BJ875DRAFT_150101 [Amylocarpus encephaloides]